MDAPSHASSAGAATGSTLQAAQPKEHPSTAQGPCTDKINDLGKLNGSLPPPPIFPGLPPIEEEIARDMLPVGPLVQLPMAWEPPLEPIPALDLLMALREDSHASSSSSLLKGSSSAA